MLFFYNDNRQMKLGDFNKDICIVWIWFNIYISNIVLYMSYNIKIKYILCIMIITLYIFEKYILI